MLQTCCPKQLELWNWRKYVLSKEYILSAVPALLFLFYALLNVSLVLFVCRQFIHLDSRINASCVVRWDIQQQTVKERSKEKLGSLMRRVILLFPRSPIRLFVYCNMWFHTFIRHLDEFTKYLCVYFCASAVLEYMDPAGIFRIRVQNAKPTFQD